MPLPSNLGRGFVTPLLTLILICSSAAAAEYARVEEAYGMIVGTYMGGLTIAEICSEYPRLRSQAETTSRNYLAANSALYNEVGQRMQKLALANGGEARLQRLRQEIRTLTSDTTYMRQEAKKTASSEKACTTLLQNLRRGYWDLKTRNKQQLNIIFSE